MRERATEIVIDREIERQRDRKIDRQRDREIDSQREIGDDVVPGMKTVV